MLTVRLSQLWSFPPVTQVTLPSVVTSTRAVLAWLLRLKIRRPAGLQFEGRVATCPHEVPLIKPDTTHEPPLTKAWAPEYEWP